LHYRGHDPTQDAISAMHLVLYRIVHGDVVSNEDNKESFFQSLARAGINSALLDKSSMVQSHQLAESNAQQVQAGVKRGVIHIVPCDTDKNATDAVLSHIGPGSTTQFVYAQLHDLTQIHSDFIAAGTEAGRAEHSPL
jgi:hypothetical protein